MAGEQLQFGDDDRAIAVRRIWEQALPELRGQVSRATFESYIRPILPLAIRDGEVTLGVRSGFAREWLDKRYARMIAGTLEGLVGSPVAVRFNLLAPGAEETAGQPASAPPDPPAPAVQAAAPGRPAPTATNVFSLPLQARYTFASFVVGRSNRLAQAAAAAVAADPGTAYNPLFLYGASGLGKTHLLHAIGHAVRLQNPAARVTLVDGENFTYHYVTALRERKTEDFRRHYRGVDVWLVDDIQFIAGREQTKEEFFHTFNALHQTGRQVVVASDRSPRDLRTLDERLRSRFECGLVADIAAPDLETRMAILQRRSADEGWSVPSEVICYIAGAIRTNVRALEGALTKLVAYSSIMHAPLSVDLAEEVLGDYLIESPLAPQVQKGVSFEAILAAVSEQFQVPVEAIRGPRRDRQVVAARQTAMLLCRELTGAGLAQIGAVLGGRDHTTIQRGIARLEELMRQDPAAREAAAQVRRRLER